MELSAVHGKRRVVRRLVLKGYVVVPGLEVYHADPLGVAEIRAVTPRIIQLIVVLVCSLIDGYDVLADPIGLSSLHPRDQQQRHHAPGLLI